MDTIPWYQSAIIRQQIAQIVVALTALLGVNLGGLDVDATLVSIFAGIAAVVAVWTMVTRILKPAPNLSVTAIKKEVELVADRKIPPSPTGPGSQRGFFRTSVAVMILALGSLATVAVVGLPGCVANPHKTAQTVEQHADAIYGEVTILKEQGARILQDASVSDVVKRPIAEAIVAAKPISDGLQDSLILYGQVKADLAAGTGSTERLAVVDRELAGWIAKAQPIITRLTSALGGARK